MLLPSLNPFARTLPVKPIGGEHLFAQNFPHSLDHDRRLTHDFFGKALHFVAADRIELIISFFSFGFELGIFERAGERRCGGFLSRSGANSRRPDHGAAEDATGENYGGDAARLIRGLVLVHQFENRRRVG